MYSIIHHGAVSGVTGSCHQFKLNSGESLLVDCGMFQGAEDFDVYRIVAMDDVVVYESEIAPFNVNGSQYVREGGRTQSLVLSRKKFTSPELINGK